MISSRLMRGQMHGLQYTRCTAS